MKCCLFIITWCCLLTLGCSIEDVGSKDKKALSRIDGDWIGSIKASDSQSSIKEISLTATFTSQTKNSGTFEFNFPELPDLVGRGTFTDFGDRLMLHFKKSNLPFKETSEFLEVNYFLVEDSLMFSNKELSFFLKRPEKPTTPDTPASGFTDTWSCHKTDSITWKVKLHGTEGFMIEMRSPEAATSFQKGAQTDRKEGESSLNVVLHTQHSNISSYIGHKYKMVVEGKDRAQLNQIGEASDQAINMTCSPS